MNGETHRSKSRLSPSGLLATIIVVILLVGSLGGSLKANPIAAAGAEYYVDSAAGADSNPGTLERPWRTVDKVNATTFGPGDRVLFRRGGTWGELSISSQVGTAASPITYGAYGSGANPSIQGVRMRHSRHVVLEDLTIERSEGPGVSILGDSEYVTFARCLIRNNATYGFMIWTPGQGDFSILDSAVRDNGAVQERSSGIFAKANNMVIARSEIYNNASGDPAWGYSHGIYIDTETTGAQIYENEIHGNSRGHGLASKGSARIYRNYIHNNEIAGVLLSGHDVPPNTSTTYSVYSNILAANAFGIAEYGKSSTNPMRVYIHHNTLYQNTAGWGADLYIEDPLTELEILNNAVYPAAGENGYEFAAQSSARIENNAVYHSSSQVIQYGGRSYSWSEWQALGYDTRGLNANPGFVDAAQGDFHLRSDSPCIDAGGDAGVTIDFAGNPAPVGPGFDIGAYEYQGANGAPTPTPAPPSELAWGAGAGTISAPFAVSGGLVSQSIQTVDPAAGGRAAYGFSISEPGDYVVKAMVDAPSDGSNSFFVNIGGEPIGDAMVWDIDLTQGIQERTVSWRGAGLSGQSEFVPKVFRLPAGTHELVIRGREADTRLSSLRLVPVISPPAGGWTAQVHLPFVSR
jgi:hypothetical protein